MSKSAKNALKSLGGKMMGGKKDKGSSSQKEKVVVPPSTAAALHKKKDSRLEGERASLEAQAMEVDVPLSSPPSRSQGKGKSLKVLQETMKPVDKVRMMLDGVEVDEGGKDDGNFVTDEINFTKCHENVLSTCIARYSDKNGKVPREVLRHVCSVTPKKLGEVTRDFIIPPPPSK